MNLILLHGAPASGKYTVAKALSALRGYPLLHNHLSVDLALAVYNSIEDADFFDFVGTLRTQCIEKACLNKLENLIVTLCYDDQSDAHILAQWIDIIEAHNGNFYPVYLQVDPAELARRAISHSRIGTHKIHSIELLQETLAKYAFTPIKHPNTVIVETTNMTEAQTLEKVLAAIAPRNK